MAYALVLGEDGGIETDLTVTRLADEEFYLVGAAANEVRDYERIRSRVPADGSVAIRTVSSQFGVLTVAGPRSATLLERASGMAIDEAGFPFFGLRMLPIGYVMCRALRVSYSGELGWELHMPIEMLRSAYQRLMAAGQDLGLTDIGYQALDWLGMEKAYGAIGADLDREHTPLEAGLGHLVRLDKGPFTGRDALLAQQERGIEVRRVCLLLDAGHEAMPYGMEPVVRGTEVVGFTDRGGYGARIERAIAMAYLPTSLIGTPEGLAVRILGHDIPAFISTAVPYDPQDRRRRIDPADPGRT